MKKNPLIVIVGLAVAAVAVVLGLTKDRWMKQPPVAVTTLEQTTGGQGTATETAPAATTATETAPATPSATETAPAAPATTTTTTTTTTETAPATASGSAEQAPAASAPATQQPAETAAAPPAAAPATPEAVKPTFDTVRVEKTGEAVIAGRAVAGATVTVMLDGKPVGSTTANTDGAFVVVPEKALPAGSGTLTIETKGATDTAAIKSDQSVAVIVAADQKTEPLVAVISPDAPTKVLQKPTASEQVAETAPAPAPAAPAATPVSFDAIDYDGAGNVVFIGKADKGAVVRLYVDNAVLADATAGEDGSWTYTATAPMAAGNHTLRVDAIDATGKVLSRVELPFVREEQAKVAQADQTQQQTSATAGEAASTAEATDPAATTTTTTTTTTAGSTGEAAPATAGATGEATTAAPAAPPKQGRVVIQPGNNLWRIAKVIYGTGTKFSVIYEANKDLIKNPDRIYPGQVFQTPDVVPPEQIDPHRRAPLKPDETGAVAQ